MQTVSGAYDTLSHCMETYFGKPEETNISDEMNEAVMRSHLAKDNTVKFARFAQEVWVFLITEEPRKN